MRFSFTNLYKEKFIFLGWIKNHLMTGPLGIELILFPSNLSPQPGQCFGPWFLRGKHWIRSSHCLLCRLQNRSDRSYFFYGGQERELLNENSRAPFCIYFRHDAISQYHLQWTHSLSELGPSMIEQTSFYVLRIFTFTWLPPGHHMDRNTLTAIFHWVYSRSRKSSHIDVITWNFRDMFISRFWCAHISRHLNFAILRKSYILDHFNFAFWAPQFKFHGQ